MRRRLRARILSLVAVLVLIAAAGWSWRQQQAQLAAQHLLAITPQTITHITLQLSGMVAQRFRKRGGVWWQQVTPPRRADSAQLDALTQIAAAPVLRWLPAHAVRADHLGLTPRLRCCG